MTMFGLDFAFKPYPSVKAMKAHVPPVKFVMRYLSNDSRKNLTNSEAQLYSDNDIWISVVWESSAGRMLAGKSAGSEDADKAIKQAEACGMPDGRPIYFACDFDASAPQQASINAYLSGCATVIGQHRVGIYGGYWPVSRAHQDGFANWVWQTYAWSGGQLYAGTDVYQYSNSHALDGADVDYNRAIAMDFGQWKIGVSPMAISTAEMDAIADRVVSRMITVPDYAKDLYPHDDAFSLGGWLRGANVAAVRARDGVKELLDQPLTEQQIDEIADVVANKIEATLGDDFAAKVADEIYRRMQS